MQANSRGNGALCLRVVVLRTGTVRGPTLSDNQRLREYRVSIMTEQPSAKNDVPQTGLNRDAGKTGATVDRPTADSPVVNSAADEQAIPKKLSPEEQMALYEKDLKENDWGHQPC